MKDIKLEPHKILKELKGIKTSSYIIGISFISSFNLWYLTLEFLKPDFLEAHGLISMLQLSFALTITWLVISIISIKKMVIFNTINTFGNSKNIEGDNEKEVENITTAINTFILANTLITHSSFLFIAYILNIPFVWLVSLTFTYTLLFYLFYDIALRVKVDKMIKNSEN